MTRIVYSLEFLLNLKNGDYSPPDSVKVFNDVYIYAPKPVVNRPYVDSRGRGFPSEPFLSSWERKELHKKRMEEKFKHISQQRQVGSSIQEKLQDAQEQQASLIFKDIPLSAANRPVTKSQMHLQEPRLETDHLRINQRTKQVFFGKSTVGYQAYIQIRPPSERKKDDPKTPDIFQVCSKRSWDGQFKKWRQLLHKFDPEGEFEQPATAMPADTQVLLVSAQEREDLARKRKEIMEKRKPIADTNISESSTSTPTV